MKHDYSLLGRKYGEEYTILPIDQKQELKSILSRTIDDHIQGSLFLAGGHALRELNEKMGGELLYAGIRGSVARAKADISEDVDLLVGTNYPDDAKKLLKEISLKYGKELKLRVPAMERPGERLVTYIVLGKDKYELFVDNPLRLDADEIDFQKQNRVIIANKIIRDVDGIISKSGIMEDLEANPFDFIEKNLKPLAKKYMQREVKNNWHKISDESKQKKLKKANKFVSHCLVYTVGRIVGIQLYGEEIPRHGVVRIRDKFLKEILDASRFD